MLLSLNLTLTYLWTMSTKLLTNYTLLMTIQSLLVENLWKALTMTLKPFGSNYLKKNNSTITTDIYTLK